MGPKNRCSGATGAARRLQERSGRPQDASRQFQERSGRPQDCPKSAPGGFKTAPRALPGARDGTGALQEASRRLTQAFKLNQSGGFLKSIFERSRGCSRSLNIKPTWIWGSTSPKVGVQKHIRRTCSIPLSSMQQASGRPAPCMAMHRSTLVQQ